MTECVQRHDVAPEDLARGEAILAEFNRISKEADRDLRRWLAWIIGPLAIITAGLYLVAVLT